MSRADFGANAWLVDELYEQYLQDKTAVDPAWWDFFEGYRPSVPASTTSGAPHADGADGSTAVAPATSAPAASVAPAASAAPATADVPAPAGTATPAHAGSVPVVVPAGGSAPTAPGRPAHTGDATPIPAPARPVADHPQEAPAPRDAPVEPTPATSPVATAQPATAPYAAQAAALADATATPEDATDQVQRLRGPAARVVVNMEASLEVPTATSVRAIPAKLLVDNRIVINNHLARGRGGKVSFTHLIGFALVEAVGEMPAMNAAYTQVDGKPAVLTPAHVNLGLAIDLAKPDGTRQLLVPSIKGAETMDFAQFWTAYEDVVRRARGGKLGVDDFAGTTLSLTNPGTIGTVHSVPRLMQGQGTIVGVGAMDYPAEFAGTSDEQLNRMGVSKVLTVTSTYDHRIIQGAQSGDFLRILARKLLGEDGFYDRVFAALRVPYEPIRWVREASHDPDAEAIKPARIAELIHAYRSRGHLMADTDP
ncbi:MAG TPA: 2-oxo acid dehydrogenase subunit E2, partial [Cellulomonas sp.]